jgi:CDP-paratose 2-epimerase
MSKPRAPSVLVTGSAGLVGSAVVRFFASKGMQVIGVDNDLRRRFFGPAATTAPTLAALREAHPGYIHYDVDIRDGQAMDRVFADHGADISLVVHAAAQPSHDWAATDPSVDFEINALATVQLLERVRLRCGGAVFVYVSTNKVYGDAPNGLPLVERETRWEVDPAHPYAARGVPEEMSIDRSMHSLFGCSKLSADLMVQEYGRYFGVRTACFRCGCITGGQHAAVEQHGFLAYVMKCAVRKEPYVIHGYKGKQVRDIIHADDLAAAFEQFYLEPRPGAVYNLGGSRHASCSVLEAIDLCEKATGNEMTVTYADEARKGDHVWWITDSSRFSRDYPRWSHRHDMASLITDVYGGAVHSAAP